MKQNNLFPFVTVLGIGFLSCQAFHTQACETDNHAGEKSHRPAQTEASHESWMKIHFSKPGERRSSHASS